MIWRKWLKPTIGLKIGAIFFLVLLLAMINTFILHSTLKEFDNNSKTRLIADDFYIYTKRIANALLASNAATHGQSAAELAQTAAAFEQHLRLLRSIHPQKNKIPKDQIVKLADMVGSDWAVFHQAARDMLQNAKNRPRLLNAENDLLAGVLTLGHALTLHEQTAQTRAASMLYGIIGLDALLLFGVFVLIKLTIVRPIVQLSQMSRCIAAGDYGARMILDSRDELGELALAFNTAAHETQQLLDKIGHQAKHDALTGLPNRSLLEDRLSHALNHAHRRKGKMAVVFVDLDHFKFINDSLGHDIGDSLLVIVANRLKACLREDDTVARQGGDEFVLILSDAKDDKAISLTLLRVIAAIAQTVSLDNQDLVVTCSLGISVYPEDGRDSQTLLKSADIAMYRAKEQGRNRFQFYTAEMNARATERLSLESAMRRALEHGEFLLHFQPQADLHSGRITGVEALVRWQHPENGMIAPNRFIPLAEETGLIVPLGEWVLTTACIQAKAWLDAGMPIPSVAINISAVQFRQGNLVESVKRALEITGLDPQYLELELTESLIMHHAEKVITIMAELKALGVQISLDDFGTGYSSLSYLKRLPLDKLKIDQSFVRDLTTDPGDAAIVRSVISLAHSLGLGVIAEGVETAEQFAYLGEQRCDQIQGYLLSRPIPADDLEKMLHLGRRLPHSWNNMDALLSVVPSW